MTKYALIIANTDYNDPGLAKLSAPGRDAHDFAQVLQAKEIGAFDDVIIMENEPEPIVREAIDIFFSTKKPDDLLVMYFSGHGVRDEYGALYLALKNTNRSRLRATAIKSDFIRESMDQSRSKRQVLILDCCNSGAFAQGTKGATGVSIGTGPAFEGVGYGRVVLTATDATQFAWEGDKIIGDITDNSLFTHYLVEGLQGGADQDKDGRITVDELYDYAYEQIVSRTPKQTPGKWSYKQQGEIVLRQPEIGRAVQPAPLSADLLAAIGSSYASIRETAVSQLDELLKGRHPGLALSARLMLERVIAEDDSRRVSQAASLALESFRQTDAEAQIRAAIAKKAEEDRLAAVAKKAEEDRLAAVAKKAEEDRLAAIAKKAEEDRLAAAAKKAEEDRLSATAKKTEEDRLAAVAKKAEEDRLAAVAKKAEEDRLAAAAKKAEEDRLAATAKKAEEDRLAAVAKKAEEEQSDAATLKIDRESVLAATRKVELDNLAREKAQREALSQVRQEPELVAVIPQHKLSPFPLGTVLPIVLVGLLICGIFVGGLFGVSRFLNFPAASIPTPGSVVTALPTNTAAVPTVAQELTAIPVTPTPVPSEFLPVDQADLRVNMYAYPDIIDPQKSSFYNEFATLNLIYMGLSAYDEKLGTVPAAAAKWDYNADATQLTFRLKPDLKYSDGSVLNALRFAFALQRNIDPATQGDAYYSTITDEILNAPEWHAVDPAAAGYSRAEWINKLGIRAAHEDGAACSGYQDSACDILTLTFSKPAPYFHSIMALWVSFPAKEENISAGGEKWWENPKNLVGNGPFILDVVESGVRQHFIPNNFFAGGGIPAYQLEYRYISDNLAALDAYKKGELDVVNITTDTQAAILADPNLVTQAHQYVGNCTTVFRFGLAATYTSASGAKVNSPFLDKKVREAFSLAFDAISYAREAEGDLNLPTLTWIPSGIPGYDAISPLKYDPIAARTTLRDSSFGGPEKFNALGLKLSFSDTPLNRKRYEWLAANYKIQLGVVLTLDPLPGSEAYALARDPKTFPLLYRQGWCADYPDPKSWFSDLAWRSGSVYSQRQGYKNTEFDKLLSLADAEPDFARRMTLYRQAQQLLLSDYPAVFGINDANNLLVKPWVTGYVTTPQDSWPGSVLPWMIKIKIH